LLVSAGLSAFLAYNRAHRQRTGGDDSKKTGYGALEEVRVEYQLQFTRGVRLSLKALMLEELGVRNELRPVWR
jgi:hypothetical protein